MAFTSSWRRNLTRHAAVLAAAGLLSSGLAHAQWQPGAATTPSESAMKSAEMLRSPADPVVGIVEGRMITLSDVGRAVPMLPEGLRSLPFDTLFPVVLDQIIDHEALVAMARRHHLDEDPGVRRDIDAAIDRILEGVLLARVAVPQASEEAIQAHYAKMYGNNPATEETRARHILVSTEVEATALIAQLNKGADFLTLAKEHSKDPDADTGGDLGFFRRDQVWPEFADVAFALRPGQFSQTPIHNEFGWHVVKVEERRIVAPPTYSEVHDLIREQLLQEAVQQTIGEARTPLTIRRFNMDGSPLGALPDITIAQPLEKREDAPPRQ